MRSFTTAGQRLPAKQRKTPARPQISGQFGADARQSRIRHHQTLGRESERVRSTSSSIQQSIAKREAREGARQRWWSSIKTRVGRRATRLWCRTQPCTRPQCSRERASTPTGPCHRTHQVMTFSSTSSLPPSVRERTACAVQGAPNILWTDSNSYNGKQAAIIDFGESAFDSCT